jgi:hypothetical protein
MVLDWLWANYYGQARYRDVWFRWDGKPLVVAFDPMTLTVPIAAGAPIRYTVRNWTGRAKSEQTAGEGWQWFFGPPQSPVDGLSADGVAFVYPRFDEAPAKAMGAGYITWPPRSIDPLLVQCAYEHQWEALAARRDRLRMIVVYAWNLYGEQAYIEPASAAPPRPSIGYDYVDRTRAYYGALVQGRPFSTVSRCADSGSPSP